MVWRWRCRGGMEQALLVLTKDAFSLEETSMRDLWIAFIIIDKYLDKLFVFGISHLPGNLGLQQRRNSLSTNGLHMSLRYVEYGPRDGVVPSVQKGRQPVPWASCVWTQCELCEVCCVASLFGFGDTGPGNGASPIVYSLLRDYIVHG